MGPARRVSNRRQLDDGKITKALGGPCSLQIVHLRQLRASLKLRRHHQPDHPPGHLTRLPSFEPRTVSAELRRGASSIPAMSRRLPLLALVVCLAATLARVAADTAGGGALSPQAGDAPHLPGDPAKSAAEEEAVNGAMDEDIPDDGSTGFPGQPAASCAAAATSAGVRLVAWLTLLCWAVRKCDLSCPSSRH